MTVLLDRFAKEPLAGRDLVWGAERRGWVTKRSGELLILLGFGGRIPSLAVGVLLRADGELGARLRIARGVKFLGGFWEG